MQHAVHSFANSSQFWHLICKGITIYGRRKYNIMWCCLWSWWNKGIHCWREKDQRRRGRQRGKKTKKVTWGKIYWIIIYQVRVFIHSLDVYKDIILPVYPKHPMVYGSSRKASTLKPGKQVFGTGERKCLGETANETKTKEKLQQILPYIRRWRYASNT